MSAGIPEILSPLTLFSVVLLMNGCTRDKGTSGDRKKAKETMLAGDMKCKLKRLKM